MKPIIGHYGKWVVLTYLNIVSAVIGISMSLMGNLSAAILFLLICGLCDMFDGPIARRASRTTDQKSYGVQVDALADIISFGVFPLVIGYGAGAPLIISAFPNLSIIISIIVAAIYILAAQIRLAYFNVEEMKLLEENTARNFYQGMPVTFVALLIPFIYALSLIFEFSLRYIYNPLLLLLAIAFVSKLKIPKMRGNRLLVLLGIGIIIGIIVLIVIHIN